MTEVKHIAIKRQYRLEFRRLLCTQKKINKSEWRQHWRHILLHHLLTDYAKRQNTVLLRFITSYMTSQTCIETRQLSRGDKFPFPVRTQSHYCRRFQVNFLPYFTIFTSPFAISFHHRLLLLLLLLLVLHSPVPGKNDDSLQACTSRTKCNRTICS